MSPQCYMAIGAIKRDRKARQSLELELIHRWRSPFNKENWTFWGTPFVGGKLEA